MKVSEAIDLLNQFDGDVEVTLTFVQGAKVKPGTPPVKSDRPFVGYQNHYIPRKLPTYPPSPDTIWYSSTTEYKQ